MLHLVPHAVQFVVVWLVCHQVIARAMSQYRSGGSPPALVVFSAVFVLVYILPGIARLTPARLTAMVKDVIQQRTLLCVVACCTALVVALFLLDTRLLGHTVAGLRRRCPVLLESNKGASQQQQPGQPGMQQGTPFAHLLPAVRWGAFLGYAVPRWLSAGMVTAVDFANSMGEVPRALPAGLLLYYWLQVTTPQRYAPVLGMAFRLLAAGVTAGVVSASLKMATHRYRPLAYVSGVFQTLSLCGLFSASRARTPHVPPTLLG